MQTERRKTNHISGLLAPIKKKVADLALGWMDISRRGERETIRMIGCAGFHNLPAEAIIFSSKTSYFLRCFSLQHLENKKKYIFWKWSTTPLHFPMVSGNDASRERITNKFCTHNRDGRKPNTLNHRLRMKEQDYNQISDFLDCIWILDIFESNFLLSIWLVDLCIFAQIFVW